MSEMIHNYIIMSHVLSTKARTGNPKALHDAVVGNLFRTAERFETEFLSVDRPLKNHKCFCNTTARIYSELKTSILL